MKEEQLNRIADYLYKTAETHLADKLTHREYEDYMKNLYGIVDSLKAFLV